MIVAHDAINIVSAISILRVSAGRSVPGVLLHHCRHLGDAIRRKPLKPRSWFIGFALQPVQPSVDSLNPLRICAGAQEGFEDPREILGKRISAHATERAAALFECRGDGPPHGKGPIRSGRINRLAVLLRLLHQHLLTSTNSPGDVCSVQQTHEPFWCQNRCRMNFVRQEATVAEAKQMVDALVRDRQGGTIAATAALGGVALIIGLALKALPGRAPAPTSASPTHDASPPAAPRTPFDHAEISEDEARTMLRAMVAATLADGLMDAAERERLYSALAAAKIGAAGRAWLDKELTEPADVDELAAGINGPEQAARIYAAARLAIDPDTLQEREFLKMLAEALDLPDEATDRLERELDG
jgi:uncharacterized membrane protein YebE (DUF533 family)